MSDKKSLPILNPTSQQLVQSVGTSLKTTAKLLANSTMPTESDWAWWNGLSWAHKMILLANLKNEPIHDVDYYNVEAPIQTYVSININHCYLDLITSKELLHLLKIEKLKIDIFFEITPIIYLKNIKILLIENDHLSYTPWQLEKLSDLNIIKNYLNSFSQLNKLQRLYISPNYTSLFLNMHNFDYIKFFKKILPNTEIS